MFVAHTECRICGKKWVAIFPTGTDDTCLECPACGHASGDALEYIPASRLRQFAPKEIEHAEAHGWVMLQEPEFYDDEGRSQDHHQDSP